MSGPRRLELYQKIRSGISASERSPIRGRDEHNDGPQPSTQPCRRILTPTQAAELLGIDDKTVTRWARNAYLPAHPMGEGKKKYWRFFEDELIGWLMSQNCTERAA